MRSILLIAVSATAVTATASAALHTYTPATNVAEHSEIDLDQKGIEDALEESPKDYTEASTIYNDGANSVKGSGSMRTIAGFSKDLSGEPEYDKFVTFFGDKRYAHMFVSGALASTAVDFTTAGDVDFSVVNDDKTRQQAIKKGTVYLNIWMYAIHEMEAALGACDPASTDSNNGAAHYWDEAVAFYTGSLVSSSSDGKLMYGLAEKRASNFGTADSSGDAEVNNEVFADFALGLSKIQAGMCGGLRGVIDRIIAQGYVPILQGALKYGHSVANWDMSTEPSSGESGDLSKAKAEGATFAAGIVGRLHACSHADAITMYDNLKIGAASTSFTAVLAAFEDNYACLGITCADVGAYPSSRSACTDVWPDIAGYSPGTNVLAHNKIDLDQNSLQSAVGEDPPNYAHATAVYSTGGYSPRRTIKGMSRDLTGEPEYDKFVAYYGDKDYADKWVSGALAGTAVTYSSNGNADFAAVNDAATREQAIKKGTVYLNIWMYAIHEMEAAIGRCSSASGADNTNAIHAWDEGMAFYTGSLEGTDGSGSGKLMYALATSRGSNFGIGEAVNTAVKDLFTAGKADLEAGNCANMRATTDAITAKGFIPIIQGVLKYAWSVGIDGGGLKYQAEAATFAAAVLGRLAHCSSAAAATVYANTRIGASSTDFYAVKAALEDNYECMGITCAEVGGYISGGVYKEGFSAGCNAAPPSPPADTLSTGALVGIIAGGLAVVATGVAVLFLMSKSSTTVAPKAGGAAAAGIQA